MATRRVTIAQPDVRLRMQYLGVMTLLGRAANDLPARHEDHYGIDLAFRDANNWLLVNGSPIVYLPTGARGYSAFERSQVTAEEIKEAFTRRGKR